MDAEHSKAPPAVCKIRCAEGATYWLVRSVGVGLAELRGLLLRFIRLLQEDCEKLGGCDLWVVCDGGFHAICCEASGDGTRMDYEPVPGCHAVDESHVLLYSTSTDLNGWRRHVHSNGLDVWVVFGWGKCLNMKNTPDTTHSPSADLPTKEECLREFWEIIGRAAYRIWLRNLQARASEFES